MGFAASGATCEETLKVRAFSRDGEAGEGGQETDDRLDMTVN